MSKSLKLENGDLSVNSGRSFDTVSGRDKLAQDLRLWILERIGIDSATPDYGSTLDGGIVNGQVVPSYIGRIISQETLNSIRSDVINLITKYQSLQYNKIRTEIIRYQGSTTISSDETIAKINQVDVRAVGTTVVVQVNLTTAANSTLKLTFPLGV